MLRLPSSSYSVNRLVHRGFLYVYARLRGAMCRARAKSHYFLQFVPSFDWEWSSVFLKCHTLHQLVPRSEHDVSPCELLSPKFARDKLHKRVTFWICTRSLPYAEPLRACALGTSYINA